MNKCFAYRNNSPNALELKCIEVWLISCTLFVFFALLEYFVVLFGIRYDKYWRHKKQDLERINATTWERPNENTQPALAAVAAAATAAAAASNNTNSTNHHRPTQLPPLLHHRVTNNRVDNLRLFGGSSKIVPQEETQDHHTKQMASPRSTIIRVSFNNNVIIICLIYMQPKLIKNTAHNFHKSVSTFLPGSTTSHLKRQ